MEHLTVDQFLYGLLPAIILSFVGALLWSVRAAVGRFVVRVVQRYVSVRREPNEPVQAAVRLSAAEEPGSASSFVRSDPAESPPVLALNADELAAVQRMLDHKHHAAKPTQTSTIQAGFGIKGRGDSPKYRRAKAIYDALWPQELPGAPRFYEELETAIRAEVHGERNLQ